MAHVACLLSAHSMLPDVLAWNFISWLAGFTGSKLRFVITAAVTTRRNMPIRAGFSEDGAYVVCGSDGGAVFVWDAAPANRWELFVSWILTFAKFRVCADKQVIISPRFSWQPLNTTP